MSSLRTTVRLDEHPDESKESEPMLPGLPAELAAICEEQTDKNACEETLAYAMSTLERMGHGNIAETVTKHCAYCMMEATDKTKACTEKNDLGFMQSHVGESLPSTCTELASMIMGGDTEEEGKKEEE